MLIIMVGDGIQDDLSTTEYGNNNFEKSTLNKGE